MDKVMVETPEGFGELVGRLAYSDGTVKALVRFEGDQWPGDRQHRVRVTVAFDLDQVRLADGRALREIDAPEPVWYTRG